MKLLIVDSDHNMVGMLSAWLRILGYEVHTAFTGEQARAKWLEHKPDFVILESGLEDVDALAMCLKLRDKHDALVIVVTDEKEVSDEVRCLEAGADDYLRKPFYPDQLLAHIHAVARRARSSVQLPPSSCINVGSLRIDPLNNIVTIRGKTIRLTPIEGRLLAFLATNVNHVCTADQIVDHVWGFNNAGDAVLIKSHIYHLRQKIEPDPTTPQYIMAIPGVGYKLVRHLEEASESSF